MSRLLTVARLHTVAWLATTGWPWLILASSFVLNVAIFAAIGDRIEGGARTGGLLSLYITVLVVAATWVVQVFPFASGMSVTRREFYAATALFAVAQAVAYAVPLYLLSLVEQATNGWGVSVSFFALVGVDNGLLQIAIYAVPLLLMSFLGMFLGTVFCRWGSNGIFALTTVALLGSGVAAVLVTWSDTWPAVGRWFASQSAGSLFAGWPMLASLVLAVGGYAILRRAPA